MRRALFAALLVLALAVGATVAALSGGGAPGTARATPSPGATAGGPADSGSGSPAGSASPTPGSSDTPGESPSPQPSPTPITAIAPLTGRTVTPARAARHPIAVMIDDQKDARPQSGFNAASVVWQAPAEGGIPRYMLIFAERDPGAVGPVRSARQYFIEWAAEWRATYVHVGGSPQALATLKKFGTGKLVYNADDFRWEGTYLWRIKTRFAPHNVYTDGKHLRSLGTRVGAKPLKTPKPVWSFAADAPLELRPSGGKIDITYPENQIGYRYDRKSNTYLRLVYGKAHVDAADKKRVAPKNVVIMVMRFGPLNDGHPNKKRLEAHDVGSGRAWISTNGITIQGTWRKDSVTGPTRFFDKKGNPVVLTIGQTFVQVVPVGTPVKFVAGKRQTPSTSPTPSPSPSLAP